MSRLSVEWMLQDVEVCRSRPDQPQENPRHERMHRTLKRKSARPPSEESHGQQVRFGRFKSWMNFERGHEGIEIRAQGELDVPSRREYSARPKPFDYSGHREVRRVRSGGELKL